MQQFSFQYRNLIQTRNLIEKSYSYFIKSNRIKKRKSDNIKGKYFLTEIQQIMIELYRTTRMGKILPDGYPVIL